jgi:phage terminase large subunit-like protein
VIAAEQERQIMSGVGGTVAKFAENWIVQTKGRWAGKPITLEPWQRAWFDELFLVYDDGERVYREALLGISRKNGKSTVSAVLALYLLLASGEQGPEVYAAAASKDQARIVFNQAREFVEASPRLSDWLKPTRDRILCTSNNGVFRVLAADAPLQYGLNPSGVIIDELWAHRNPELYFALTTGQGARLNPLVVSITTAGYDRDSIGYSTYERGKKLEDEGGVKAMRKAGFFFRWYEAPPTATVQDPEGWQAANPSSWIRAEDLRREAERLPESVFRRLHLNQWTESEEAWIKPYEWDRCKGEPYIDPQQPAFMGLDVGIRRDTAAITIAQWHGEELHIKQHILDPLKVPNFGVADIRDAVRYTATELEGIREIAYDPWSFRESAEILQTAGFPMVEFPQNSSRMGPASENLYELITERRLVHDGNREARAHVLSAVVAPTARGGWRIDKRKSLERIDFAVSTSMAADRAVTLRYVKPKPARLLFM